MEMINCPRCGRVFAKMREKICPECIKEEEDTFNLIKDYIDENPMCTLVELANETGVAQKKILRYIKEGRLEISKGMRGEIRCEACGKPILRGHYCDTCVIQINQNVNDMFKDHLAKDRFKGARMHTSPKKQL